MENGDRQKGRLVFVFAFSRPKVLASKIKNKLLGYLKYGLDVGWEEMRRSADMKIPGVFYYIIKFLVPVYLVVLFVGWLWQDLRSDSSVILMRGVESQTAIYQWVSRLTIIGVILGIAVLVGKAWSKKNEV